MRQPVLHLRSEAEYSHERDVELIETTRRRTAIQERRERLAQTSHIHDPAVLEALERLGYDDTVAPLLLICPLVQVAWADGTVTKPERDHILAVADLRGIKPDTAVYERLISWLDRRPSDEFFECTLNAIARVLSEMPPTEREPSKQALLLCCHDAAETPCHLFGQFRRIRSAKRKAIEHIRGRLRRCEQAPG